MKNFILSMALAGALVVPGTALAQTETASEFDEPGFSWDGFYTGVGVSVANFSSGETLYMPEAIAGYNLTIDQLLIGVEAGVSQGLSSRGTGAFQATGEARAGVLVTDAVLLYTSGGIGYYCIPNTIFGVVGAGVELAVNDTLSVDFGYEHWMRPGQTSHGFEASLKFHF